MNGTSSLAVPKPSSPDATLPLIGLFIASAHPVAMAAQLSGDGTTNRYRIDDLRPVVGELPAALTPSLQMLRITRRGPLALTQGLLPIPGALTWMGTTEHLRYTSAADRQTLSSRSRGALPAGEDSLAVVIPIRKSQAWWDLAQDERQAHFQAAARHTAIGLPYVDRIFRTLYHCRYFGAASDFVTYFEFPRECAADFRSLLAKLRDPKQNPEWNYVDLEYEIWMTKLA